jgi:hypothetical protein
MEHSSDGSGIDKSHENIGVPESVGLPIPEPSTSEESKIASQVVGEKKGSGWLLKTLEIIFTAVVASALTVFTTLYLQKRSLPKLSLDYSWCIVDTAQYPDDKSQFITMLVDLQSQSIVRGTTYNIKVNAKDISSVTFTPDKHSYIGKVIVNNEGSATATNVRIGVGYRFPTNITIKVSPNVHAAIATVEPNQVHSDSYFWPTRYEVQIEDIPPYEKAFITLSWELDPATKNEIGESVKPNFYYIPEILYISSKETLGKIRNYIPYRMAADIQGDSLSDTEQPWWKAPIKLNKKSTIEMRRITDSDKIQIDVHFDSPPGKNPSAPHDRE